MLEELVKILKVIGFCFLIATSVVNFEIFYSIHARGVKKINIEEPNLIVLAFEYPLSLFTLIFSVYLLINFMRKNA